MKLLMLIAIFIASNALAAAATHCTYDRDHLLSLDEQQFDQDMTNGGGGWRALAGQKGCERMAADLLRDYRAAHHSESSILYWHEGQVRASIGDYAAAIPLLEKSRKPASEDNAGWNPYVDATVAFLRKDRHALDDARARLLAVKPMDGVPVKDGFVELKMDDGSTAKFAWPMNIDVVDGLRNCFGKPYSEAYADACRHPAKPTN